jgi:hypothetical protein
MSNSIKDSRVVCRCGDARPARTFFKLPQGFRSRRDPIYYFLFLPSLLSVFLEPEICSIKTVGTYKTLIAPIEEVLFEKVDLLTNTYNMHVHPPTSQ